MAFHHWWTGFWATEAEYEWLLPHFTAAAAKAVLSPKSRRVLDGWRQHPSEFEQDVTMSEEAAGRAHAFIWAFNLPGFDELAKEFLTQRGEFAGFASEERLFRMVMTARHTPVSILWHALGYERVSLLPGHMGNMLLHPREIAHAQEKAEDAYAETSPEALLGAARRYCGWSVHDETLRDVIGFLPDGLARAKDLQLGFLALARPQI